MKLWWFNKNMHKINKCLAKLTKKSGSTTDTADMKR